MAEDNHREGPLRVLWACVVGCIQQARQACVHACSHTPTVRHNAPVCTQAQLRLCCLFVIYFAIRHMHAATHQHAVVPPQGQSQSGGNQSGLTRDIDQINVDAAMLLQELFCCRSASAPSAKTVFCAAVFMSFSLVVDGLRKPQLT